jgi:phosphohistidine phosphatase SixA
LTHTGASRRRYDRCGYWSQAEGLLDSLADLRVQRLLTSPSLRCRQTLLPLAAALDLDLESVDDLGADGDVDHLVDLLAGRDSDGAVLYTHGEVLAEQPLAVRAEPGEVERLMIALLDAADAGLPPAAPTWVTARATPAGAVVGDRHRPASLPLSGLQLTPSGRRPRPRLRRQADATPVGQAGQPAERLGGELTIATGEVAPAGRLLLRFPLAALPDELWPDQSPSPPQTRPWEPAATERGGRAAAGATSPRQGDPAAREPGRPWQERRGGHRVRRRSGARYRSSCR